MFCDLSENNYCYCHNHLTYNYLHQSFNALLKVNYLFLFILSINVFTNVLKKAPTEDKACHVPIINSPKRNMFSTCRHKSFTTYFLPLSSCYLHLATCPAFWLDPPMVSS